VLVAVLGVIALAAAAGGLPVATPDGGEGTGAAAPETGAPSSAPTAPELGGVPSVVVAVLVLAALAALVWTVVRGDPPARIAVVVVALALFVGLAALLDTLARGGAVPAGGFDTGLATGGSDGGSADGGGGLAVPPLLLAVAAFVAVALPAALFVLTRASDETAATADEAVGGRAAIARAAGRAADRIEGNERALDNEVYRCWQEMTTPLEPTNPATTTPAEFERTAVDRGVDPDDARELTAMFERVRYGDRSPTDDDERRAVELLRRIETASDDGSPGPRRPDDATAGGSDDG